MSAQPPSTPNYYHYDPSLPAAIVATVAYGLTTFFHVYQLIRWRTWYFIPFLLGGLSLVVGYLARSVSISQQPNYDRNIFIVQTVLILVAPALYAASIYMILGRIILLLDAEPYALIRRSWLTKVFVAGDVVSFLVQAGGGAMMAAAEDPDVFDTAQAIVLVGLAVQIVIFGLFIIVTAVFHRRISLRPTHRSRTVDVAWNRYILVLYGVSALVMIRSIFRTVEFIQGRDGELMTNEAYLYGFDTLLMLILSVIFNIFHPGTIISNAYKGAVQLDQVDSQYA
ncbi:hypothetical protein S7711_08317 [Stachybotrys chartarum IBT 7711]|uniref:Uncharacterized protein n=1 Tax=Stachybotrys chartarum (strain CBS 109288 / IBT 7711) TaxID=1280523 RepID=A0A084AJJ9_STACB|nr:hypothetical protein S7711_08317 [Stachybotrys chartarum IBT 7711]KFA45634.1 hypothetical protein S40293_09122 [Stachybotrys chartarum IBT 40293]KFA75519.1 hypothetical protein S40288_01234 [Stachybotrys chartarum IBT 40288]